MSASAAAILEQGASLAKPDRIVVVTGSRTWKDEDAIQDALDEVIPPRAFATIYHGDAKAGADRIIARLPAHRLQTIVAVPADWNGPDGRGAGFKRNALMLGLAMDMAAQARCPLVVLAFWDGKSKGTKHCFELAIEYGIQTRVFPSKELWRVGLGPGR